MTANRLLMTAGLLLAQASAGAAERDPKCGLHCLYVALKAQDSPVSLTDLEKKLGPPTGGGYSLGLLQETAGHVGFHTLAVSTSVENLKRRDGRFSCILHLDEHHFACLAGFDGQGQAQIVDPPGEYSLPLETLSSRWSGAALLLSKEPLVAEEDLPRPFPWGAAAWGAGGLVLLSALGVVVVRSKSSK